MAESQNVEYKESWRDEYLKWVCGFANAQGGVIYIGIDDSGRVIGVNNAKRLLEDIPNKIQNGLGIVAEVNIRTQEGLDYIEIRVNPSSYPVSYHGEYHYRSGSTKQQLTGIALSQFIMRKTGMHWEDETVDDIAVEDLDEESFRIFRREALRRKRMTEDELNISNAELLSKLHLVSHGKLKRSAILLFHRDPGIIQNVSYVKIGKFGEGSDVLYQDTLEYSLIRIADQVIDLIYLKYLKARIDYVHDRRVETYPFPRTAVREAVFNALAHNAYTFGVPIQIRISDEEMIISNSCILPDGWTAETLLAPHDSIPYNPDIANVFFRCGYIETWGQGIDKICESCREMGADLPRFELRGNGIRVHFKAVGGSPEYYPGLTEVRSEDIDDYFTDVIMTKIKSNPQLSQSALADLLRIPASLVSRILKKLYDSGVISWSAGRHSGSWEILSQPSRKNNFNGPVLNCFASKVMDSADKKFPDDH